MPRVIVTADPEGLPAHSDDRREPAVLLDEQIQTVHLSTGHAAAQFVERVAWALRDAEDLGRTAAPLRA